MNNSSIVVYTAITDNYDVLMEPIYPDQDVDFVCFTDNRSQVKGVWKARDLPDFESSRDKFNHVKILPHEHLAEYDISIWIDGKLWLTGDVNDIVEIEDSVIVTRQQPHYDCIYDQAEGVVTEGLADPDVVKNYISRLRNEGFPENYGSSDVSLLIRRHNDQYVRAVMNTWWDEYRKGPNRTQLTFEYALWKHKSDINRLPFNQPKLLKSHVHKPSSIFGYIQKMHLRSLEKIAKSPNHKSVIYEYIILVLTMLPWYFWMCAYVMRTQGLMTLAKKGLGKIRKFVAFVHSGKFAFE